MVRVISAKCGLHSVNLEFSTRDEERISVHINVSNLTCVCVYTSCEIKYTDNNRKSL